ncbi:hypothetical protein D8I30_04335 [Brevundimonas naejangsanensis]|uniref:Uncharacterized protein n=1 Tax=Brevundimonas naejangsanensis TaxID=588932 RepID=A0A494RDU6_9CAUL|nr:hypothetical protein [Brevundimonas naejangsanensis]AYG94495.1 hypothetical protein D8I30_04335 [Brevundimonas naejangsanensis]
MLGVVVLLSACQQWLSLFNAQADMKLGPSEILACLATALPYIFISQVLRACHEEGVSLEAYYPRHRPALAGALLIPVITSFGVNIFYAVTLHEAVVPTVVGLLAYHGVRFSCILPMLIWPAVAVQRTALAVLIAHTVLLMWSESADLRLRTLFRLSFSWPGVTQLRLRRHLGCDWLHLTSHLMRLGSAVGPCSEWQAGRFRLGLLLIPAKAQDVG